MQSLGELLLQHGWVSHAKLAEAFGRQRKVGGRLGTCLLEVGALNEEALLRALSAQHGLPAADLDDLRQVPETVFGLLSGDQAARYQAVPFRALTTRVDIALLDVEELTQRSDLAFILGKELNVHVANEARIYEALALYYGKECPVRFARLLEQLNQQRDRRGREPQPAPAAATPPPETAPPRNRQRPPARPASRTLPKPPAAATWKARGSIPLTQEDLDSLGFSPGGADEPAPTAVPFPEGGTPPAPLTLEEVEARLQHSSSPQEVGEALLRFLAGEFVRVLLFRVKGGEVQGWMGHGPALDRERFAGYATPLGEPSAFLNLDRGGGFFLGSLAPMPPHLDLVACWNGNLTNECALLPIRLRDRMVCVVYGDRDCLGLRGIDLAMLRRLASKTAVAFELCIMQQKLKKS